jgi:hypothetical protein
MEETTMVSEEWNSIHLQLSAGTLPQKANRTRTRTEDHLNEPCTTVEITGFEREEEVHEEWDAAVEVIDLTV